MVNDDDAVKDLMCNYSIDWPHYIRWHKLYNTKCSTRLGEVIKSLAFIGELVDYYGVYYGGW